MSRFIYIEWNFINSNFSNDILVSYFERNDFNLHLKLQINHPFLSHESESNGKYHILVIIVKIKIRYFFQMMLVED